MRHSGRWLTYRTELYHFEPFGARLGGRTPLWAVFCRGRMVGTMPFREREAIAPFTHRAMRWLDDHALRSAGGTPVASASPDDEF